MRQDIHFIEAPFCAVGQSKLDCGHGLFSLKPFEDGEVVVDYATTSKSWQRVFFEDVPPAHKSLCWCL